MGKERVKRAAWLLLLLLALDLSTEGVCGAATLPASDGRGELALRAGNAPATQEAQNPDGDGCFCCCTHVLPGAHFVLTLPLPEVPAESVSALIRLPSPVHAFFHPPKN